MHILLIVTGICIWQHSGLRIRMKLAWAGFEPQEKNWSESDNQENLDPDPILDKTTQIWNLPYEIHPKFSC